MPDRCSMLSLVALPHDGPDTHTGQEGYRRPRPTSARQPSARDRSNCVHDRRTAIISRAHRIAPSDSIPQEWPCVISAHIGTASLRPLWVTWATPSVPVDRVSLLVSRGTSCGTVRTGDAPERCRYLPILAIVASSEVACRYGQATVECPSAMLATRVRAGTTRERR